MDCCCPHSHHLPESRALWEFLNHLLGSPLSELQRQACSIHTEPCHDASLQSSPIMHTVPIWSNWNLQPHSTCPVLSREIISGQHSAPGLCHPGECRIGRPNSMWVVVKSFGGATTPGLLGIRCCCRTSITGVHRSAIIDCTLHLCNLKDSPRAACV